MSFLIAMALWFAGGEVNYIPAKDVTAAMAKTPAPIIKTDNYSVMAVRRTAAGQSEVHEKDTDVFYVIDGAATFITGGSMIEGKSTGQPVETRGTGIQNGQSRRIAKGDVLTIPAGTPHWFSGVEGSVTYFVVKVK